MQATLPLFWKIGAISGASAVLLGAFGAHGLQKHLEHNPKAIANWQTAANYHLIHSGALLIAAANRKQYASVLFTSGIVVFSGSLYLLVLSGYKQLGAVTPIGGLFLVGGWIALLV
jgi:uncharacterized membrane protein YgdD (TMEM256/DUF423 family)